MAEVSRRRPPRRSTPRARAPGPGPGQRPRPVAREQPLRSGADANAPERDRRASAHEPQLAAFLARGTRARGRSCRAVTRTRWNTSPSTALSRESSICQIIETRTSSPAWRISRSSTHLPPTDRRDLLQPGEHRIPAEPDARVRHLGRVVQLELRRSPTGRVPGARRGSTPRRRRGRFAAWGRRSSRCSISAGGTGGDLQHGAGVARERVRARAFRRGSSTTNATCRGTCSSASASPCRGAAGSAAAAGR